MSDPYINPECGILRNKFGLTNQESLDRARSQRSLSTFKSASA